MNMKGNNKMAFNKTVAFGWNNKNKTENEYVGDARDLSMIDKIDAHTAAMETFAQEQERCLYLVQKYQRMGKSGQPAANAIKKVLKKSKIAFSSDDIDAQTRALSNMAGCL